jgi:hypothetical protein
LRKLFLTTALCLSVSGGTVGITAQASNGITDRQAIVNGLMCIHKYEGSWTDPNAPYYGGLQMDWNFMENYGASFLERWGTADHWPIWAQIQAGIRGQAVQGWYAWPNTARLCGLI